jgi:hypothetical protein
METGLAISSIITTDCSCVGVYYFLLLGITPPPTEQNKEQLSDEIKKIKGGKVKTLFFKVQCSTLINIQH